MVTEVSIEYGRTVNLGNYESERLQVGLTSTVDDGDDAQDVICDLAGQAKEIVQGRLREAAEQRRLERDRAFYGRSARPKVDELDGEEDDPAEGS